MQREKSDPHRSRVSSLDRNGIRLLQLLVVVGVLFNWALVVEADSNLTDDSESHRIIVKYRGDGPHALRECADKITSTGRSFKSHLSDRSSSLDRLMSRYGISGRQRAIFRAPSHESLDRQRQALRRRWVASGEKFPRGRKLERLEPESLPDLSHVYQMAVPQGVDMSALLADLKADPHVEYAQPSHLMDLDQAFIPNDPFFHSEGSWGQSFRDLWGPDRVRAPEAWSRSQGEGTIVAVVDTGLDSGHPDIVENLWINDGEDLNGNGVADPEDLNGIDDDDNGFIDDLTGFDFANSVDADEDGLYVGAEDVSDADPFDDNGHGSHVAGTIAAVGHNGIGIIGIAPRARVMALKGFQREGPARDIDLWRAVLYAAEMGATVVNNSWSCGIACPDNPLAEEVLGLVEALGTVVVTSAGNSRDDVLFRSPENGTQAISVGAIGLDDRLSDFSNRGWLMDVVAPGGGPDGPLSIRTGRRNILSLLSSGAPSFRDAFSVGGDYLRFAGTSMSSPHVTGAVAVLRSLRPDLSPSDVRRLIRMSARDLGVEGHDARFGAGALDVARLIEMDLPDLELSIRSPVPGTLHDPNSGDLVIVGRAEGRDLVNLEVEVGAGLSANHFTSISDFESSAVRSSGPSNLGADVLARWDASTVPDGPYVLRVRATLRDGRVVEEHSVIGVERNAPIRLSRGDRAAAKPSVSGRRVVWQIEEEEADPDGFVSLDLEIGGFRNALRGWSSRSRKPKALFRLDGAQFDPLVEGRELVWGHGEDGVRRFDRCRLERGSMRCDPDPVSTAEGRFFEMHLGREWLVWMRIDRGVNQLEGCPLGPSIESCSPRPLIDPDAGDGWILDSFDGDTLILRRGFREQGRCRLTSEDGLCKPEIISFAAGTPNRHEFEHDGNLLAFETLGIEGRLPPGCDVDDPEIGCAFAQTPVKRVYACFLGAEDPMCDPVPITPSVPIDSFRGKDVSRNRVTWAIADGASRPAIHFCQFVPETQECEDQRLGGSLAPQGHPSMDSHRIVWEDARLGVGQIYGLELPRFFAPRRLNVRPGRSFRIFLRGFPGERKALEFEVEGIDGFTPEDERIRMVSIGRKARGVALVGRVPWTASEKARWKVRGTGAGGLFTEQVVEIAVERRRPRPRWFEFYESLSRSLSPSKMYPSASSSF